MFHRALKSEWGLREIKSRPHPDPWGVGKFGKLSNFHKLIFSSAPCNLVHIKFPSLFFHDAIFFVNTGRDPQGKEGCSQVPWSHRGLDMFSSTGQSLLPLTMKRYSKAALGQASHVHTPHSRLCCGWRRWGACGADPWTSGSYLGAGTQCRALNKGRDWNRRKPEDRKNQTILVLAKWQRKSFELKLQTFDKALTFERATSSCSSVISSVSWSLLDNLWTQLKCL